MNNKLTLIEIDGRIFVELNDFEGAVEFKIVAPKTLGVIVNEKVIQTFLVTPEAIRNTIKNNGLWLVSNVEYDDTVEIRQYKLAS